MNKKLLSLIFVPLILCLLISSVSCETQTVYPSDDAYVSEDHPNTNYDETYLFIGENAPFSFDTFHTWLKFNVPSGLTISVARVYLYQYGYGPGSPANITIHGSSDVSWSETYITWNTEPDYSSTVLDWKVVDEKGWFYWNVISNVTSGQVSSFCLKTSSDASEERFYSAEYGMYSPYLQLTVEEGEGEEEEEPDITILNLPSQFGERLNISPWSAGMLLTALLLFPFNVILILWKKGGIIALIFNFMLLGIFTSFGWLPIWTVILIGILVVAVSGLKMKEGL